MLKKNDEQRAENKKNIDDIQNDLEALVKVEFEKHASVLTERAMNKAFDISKVVVNNAFKMLGALTLFIAISTWMGIKDLKIHIIKKYEDEMRRWLAFEAPESPIRNNLDKIRTEVLLNSMMIQKNVNTISRYGTRKALKLNTVQKNRLVELVKNPRTEYGDFFDALEILSGEEKLFGAFYNDHELASQILDLLQNKNISNNKKGLIIRHLKSSPAMLGYSKSILENPQISNSWRDNAFENLADFNESEALSYAKKRLKHDGSILLLKDIIRFIVKSDPFCPELEELLRKSLNEKRKGWQQLYAWVSFFSIEKPKIILSSTIFEEKKRSKELEERKLRRAIDLLYILINHSVKFQVRGRWIGGVFAGLSYGDYSAGVESFDDFYSDKRVIQGLIGKIKNNFSQLKKIIYSVQLRDGSYYLANVQIEVLGNTRIELFSQEKLNSKKIVGKAWLYMETKDSKQYLFLRWVDGRGNFRKDHVKNIFNMNQSKFSFTYDADAINEIISKQNKEYF